MQATRFQPENALERALVHATEQPDARPEFYRLLMTSSLYVVGDMGRAAPRDRPAALEPDDLLKLAFVERAGRKLHPVFSALSRLRSFTPPEKAYFCLVGRDLFSTAKGAQFVLNPGSEFGKELAPDELAYWLSQLIETRPESELQRTVTIPAKRPAALLKALGVLFVNRQVQSARLVEIGHGKSDKHLVLAVEADSDWRKLRREISAAARLAAPKLALELFHFSSNNSDEAFVRQLLAIPPFYIRKFQEQKEQTS